MHRSTSWNRFSDEYFKHHVAASSFAPHRSSYSSLDVGGNNQLPVTYHHDPIADLAKKEKSRVKFAENAVHVIPFVLLVCAFILWLFSNPDVGLIGGDPMGARIEGLSIDGEIENDSDGTQTGFLPIVTSEETTTKGFGAHKDSINLKSF